ncbi:HlyD family type I secretion periplasmic adaptor subunit [Duganella violaceipulchra]|uniref:Membrane fusion protein (MFP) family protein n=1 Tax=Duganella violaceipulchra TaxID=2849652 RepID=A0AA41L421_9BURK|nr:HlyD family type I secretion periplasmic adaptor subunit [Duganella violaceicalia]MBV6320442.1 HlyD family type I secretion periplasmic adaptor subunit [Duganella violaceicalia]MCP2012277.1 protease secretion system membrane fusion protein [Duganella violaceicalia]
MKLIESKALASDVITHDVEPLTVHTDASAYSRLGWIIVVVGVLGFLVWACFAPLDKGVPMSGNVAKEGNRKSIQYQSGGTVEDILVKEGDFVKKGQVLVKMNGVQVVAQAEMTKVQRIAALATEARLIAERDGKKSVAIPAELEAIKADPRVQENINSQSQLFNARQSGLQNELAAADESVAGMKYQLTGLQSTRDSKKEQLAILKEQLDGLRDLERNGYVARTKLLDYERTYSQINGSIAEDIGNIGRVQRQIAELTLKRAQRVQEYQRDVRTQLAEVQRDANSLTSRQVADNYQVSNVEVRSPVDGVVIGMAVFTRGGVVQPGFRMMDVVPVEDALIVEGRLPVNLVDKVHTGLPVELMFSAFNSNTTPHIAGVVSQVSPDRLIDEHNGTPYYSVQARVTPEGMKVMQHKKLVVRPGMPVELFVKTGERTMMSYLLKPVFDRAKTSMSEE